MYNLKAVLIACLMATCWSYDRGDIGKINNIVDEALDNLRETPWLLSKIDPMIIPDFEQTGVKITNVAVRGLSKVYRAGDCVLDNGKTSVMVHVELAVPKVDIDWNYKANALFLWRSGEGKGYMRNVTVQFAIASIDKKPKVRYFRVVRLEDYQVTRMTGASFAWNWLLKRVVNVAAHMFRGKVIDIFQTNGYKVMGQLLSNVTLPV